MQCNKPVQYLSAGVALSFVGLGIALISGGFLVQGYAAKGWPTTDAQITRSEVVVTQKAAGLRRRAAAFSDFYQAKIEYQFTVNGNDFVGDQLAIGYVPEGFDPAIAKAAVAKFPVGNKITISYNPRTPETSVIDPTVDVTLWWAGVALGLISLSAGAVLWLKAIKLDEAQHAEAAIGGPTKPEKTRLQGVVNASINVPAQTTVKVPVHWFFRTMAVLIGLVFFLFGSLALTVGINMPPPQANPAVPPAAMVVGQFITIAIMAGVMFFGAFLVWIGMKRSVRHISLPAGQQIQTGGAVPQPTDVAVPQPTDFGAFIAQCGPKQDGQTHYLIIGAGMLVLGFLFCFFPNFFPLPKGADITPATFQKICLVGAGIFALFGLGILWQPLFGQNQMILLYERGIVERVGAISYAFPLDQIEQLRVQEWYEHRFAPRTFNVRAKLRGQRELAFSSTLRGDSRQIIAYLAEHIPQTELVPFQP